MVAQWASSLNKVRAPSRPIGRSLKRRLGSCPGTGDAEGLAALYEPDAVLAFPPGQMTVGRDAIRGVYERMLTQDLTFKQERPLPTLYFGDELALTATPASDEAGARAQVVHRQPDGTWMRILDRPDFSG